MKLSGAASVGVFQDDMVLSFELILQICHRKDFPKLMFRALPLNQSKTILFSV